MTWTQLLRWRRDPRRVEPGAEDPIDDELMFHFRALVSDNLSKGVSFDAAWHEAQGRFGSLARYADACRRASVTGRRWRAVLALGLAVLTLAVGWLVVDRWIRFDRTDLAGTVLDQSGNPIDGAHVLVILKTWPDGAYRQQAFATTSHADGRFRIPRLVPVEGQRAVQLAVVKDGYALASNYQLMKQGAPPVSDGFTLQLPKAPRITLVVLDETGAPVAHARVVPAERQTSDGQDHVVYFQAAQPVRSEADAHGRLALAWFERGDRAEIYVQRPGRDWELRAIDIPREGNTVMVPTSAASGVEGTIALPSS
jgi:hypothetical protein